MCTQGTSPRAQDRARSSLGRRGVTAGVAVVCGTQKDAENRHSLLSVRSTDDALIVDPSLCVRNESTCVLKQ